MKYSKNIKAVFIPTEFQKTRPEKFKLTGVILLIAYVIFFVCTVMAFVQFTEHTCDNILTIMDETDDFYMKEAVFYYDGERYTGTVDERLNVKLVIDTKGDAPEADDGIILYMGKTAGAIITKSLRYDLPYVGFSTDISDISFTKDYVLGEIESARAIVTNIICSSSVLLMLLFAIVLFIITLIIALIVSGVFWCIKKSEVFALRFNIALSSLVYPLIILAVLMAVPGGFSLILAYPSIIFRMITTIVLLYVFIAVIPFTANQITEVK